MGSAGITKRRNFIDMAKQIINLYKQVLSMLNPFMPNIKKLRWWLPGLVMGSLLTFIFMPTEFKNNAEPVQLAPNYREQWIKAAAQTAQTDADEAKRMLVDGGITADEVAALRDKNQGTELATQLEGLEGLAKEVEGDAQAQKDEYPEPGGFFSNVIIPIFWYIAWGVVSFLLALYFTLWLLPGQAFVMKWIRGDRLDPEIKAKAEADKQRREQRKQAQKEKSVFDTPPVRQFMSIYMTGDNYYDESFEIETEGTKKFLGQCGSNIMETVGAGTPKRVTATEVWVFVQKDIKTMTSVVMSEYAYNDESMRSKLAAKGEPILAEKGKVFTMESNHLRSQVKILDLEYDEGGPAPNSVFKRLAIEIAIWEKEGTGEDEEEALPRPILDIDLDAPPTILPPATPRPSTPEPFQMPPASGMREPMKPPPLQMPPDMQPPAREPLKPPPLQMPSDMQSPAREPMKPPPLQMPPDMQPPAREPLKPPPLQTPPPPTPPTQPQARPPQPPPPPPRQPGGGGSSGGGGRSAPPTPPRQPPPSPFGDTNS
jgi:hypothetical protein